MKLSVNPAFLAKLLRQIDYIAQDKPEAALKFYLDIEERIYQIPNHPFKHRQSIFSDDPNVRDLIFKGYVITYRVLKDDAVIEVFSFYKYENK
ncbi:MAG: type II toxin-antitoxin system RelE/ParE family toxin [Salibacteraceae bacterium]|jgi:plasmid stabilization system protein ParE|nr:type II toxin-antitoxin system RelE/ParE family toxin [Salibacteraceae bacterium]MDP4843651.1 type II toxin-antitoxin system RelE/ParE family toxin [Salibacteraceae bacterium]MDP4934666.1 type II toxin-antitoxin system RelE/ParE family toxin [Salibacteraceae bacterium]